MQWLCEATPWCRHRDPGCATLVPVSDEERFLQEHERDTSGRRHYVLLGLHETEGPVCISHVRLSRHCRLYIRTRSVSQ